MRRNGLIAAIVALFFYTVAATSVHAATTTSISGGQVVTGPFEVDPSGDYGPYEKIVIGSGGGTIQGNIVHTVETPGGGTGNYLVIKATGANELLLTGNNQNYNGTIDLDAGILSIGSANSLIKNLNDLHFNGIQNSALRSTVAEVNTAVSQNIGTYNRTNLQTAYTNLVNAIESQRQKGSEEYNEALRELYGVGTLNIKEGVEITRDANNGMSQGIMINIGTGKSVGKGVAAFHLEDRASLTIKNATAPTMAGGSFIHVKTDELVSMTADGTGKYIFDNNENASIRNDGTLILQNAQFINNTYDALRNNSSAFLSNVEFDNNTGSAINNVGTLVLTDYTLTNNEVGIYNEGRVLLQTSAGKTSTIKDNTTSGFLFGSGAIVIDGDGITDWQDGMAAVSFRDVTSTIDKYGTGTWKLGESFTATGTAEIDLTVRDGMLHLYRQNEVGTVAAGEIDFSSASNSSFNVTSDAVLSIGGGNTIKGNATIAAKMVTFDMTGATALAPRLTIDSAVNFTPEAVNVANTSGLGTNDYLLVQAEAGSLTGFTTKLYQDGVEYVPARSSTTGDTMIGLKTSSDGSQLSLGTADATANTTVTWSPGATNIWDVANTANWTGTVKGMSISTYLNGDNVEFGNDSAGPVEVASSGVNVRNMVVSGNYTFTGGDITGTGFLNIAGGANATFANRLNMDIDLDSTDDTITFAPTNDYTLNAVISGDGNVTMDAAGKTMTLNAANTYSGATTVKSGTLVLADATGLGNSARATVDKDATLAFTANGDSAITSLYGGGLVEKRGTGDLLISAGNYFGEITLTDGNSTVRKTSTDEFKFSGSGSGKFRHEAGVLTLDGPVWTGEFSAMNNTRVNVTADTTLNGDATFTGSSVALSDTLYITGAFQLDGSTLNIDLTDTTSRVDADGAVTLANANIVNIATWANGKHLVIDSNTGITTGNNPVVHVNGQAITSSRLTADIELDNSNKQLYLTTTSTNYAFKWTGATNNTWDYGTANWFSPDTSDTTIIAGDKVIFEQATEGTIAIAAGGVQVSEVSVTGEYTYTGGGINVASNSVGDGTFRIENGSKVLFLNGANSFENGILVGTDGELAFNNADQLGTGLLSFDNGDTVLRYHGTAPVTVANAITLNGTTTFASNDVMNLTGIISGTGVMDISGGNPVVVMGVNTYSGGTQVRNGSLSASNSKALGTGMVALDGSTADYLFSSADSATDFAGLVGRTALTRSTLVLFADNSTPIADSLSLSSADADSRVIMDGAFTLAANADIDVKSAAIVLNTGASLTVLNGISTLSSGRTEFGGSVTVEGDSILAVTGNATFDTSSASLRLAAGAGQAPGQFHAVNGDINLTGSDDLNFTIDGATADVTGKTILVADNAADIIERLGTSLFRLAVQNDNEIFVEGLNSLEEVLEGILDSGQLAGNVGPGASHFDTVMLDSSTSSSLQATMMDTFQAVTAISDTDTMVNALRQTFGEYAVEAVEAPRHNLDRFQSQIAARMSSRIAGTRIARALSGSNEAMASFASCTVPLANRIWGGGFGVWADQDTRDNVAGYKYRAGGFILGYERIIDDRFTVGFAGAYTRGNTKSKGLATEYDSDNINLGLYASYNHESNFYARAGIDFGYSWNDYDVSLIAGGRKSGEFDAQTYSARLELGYDWEPVANTFITPYVGITYAHVKQDDWRETGTADALTNWFAKSSMDVVDIPVGMRVTRVFPLGGERYIAPEIHTAWIHSAGDKQATINTGYNGSSIANSLRGINPGRNRWQVGASIKARLSERFDASVDYTYQTRSGYKDHSVYMNMGVSF